MIASGLAWSQGLETLDCLMVPEPSYDVDEDDSNSKSGEGYDDDESAFWEHVARWERGGGSCQPASSGDGGASICNGMRDRNQCTAQYQLGVQLPNRAHIALDSWDSQAGGAIQ